MPSFSWEHASGCTSQQVQFLFQRNSVLQSKRTQTYNPAMKNLSFIAVNALTISADAVHVSSNDLLFFFFFKREVTLNLKLVQLKRVPLVEFMYRVFTRMPGGVTVGDSGLCCCVPCLLSAINSLCCVLLNLGLLRPRSALL